MRNIKDLIREYRMCPFVPLAQSRRYLLADVGDPLFISIVTFNILSPETSTDFPCSLGGYK